ncbi:hypothetical protein CDAR_63661 [Caerostris darwini]|uniref:LAGLIDADG homing endonuclease n=1 Tax=Caerostris darwini TaxID=1538125 RepID=A0AAV4QFD9_9ARAC|nr:hypothetical protein CDAR_63661 [Caerostris darwini]
MANIFDGSIKDSRWVNRAAETAFCIISMNCALKFGRTVYSGRGEDSKICALLQHLTRSSQQIVKVVDKQRLTESWIRYVWELV